MQRTAERLTGPSSSATEAWEEVRRIVGDDPFAMDRLRFYAPVWSRRATDAWVNSLKLLRGIRDHLEDLGRDAKRLKRSARLLDKAATELAESLPGGADVPLGRLAKNVGSIGIALETLESAASQLDAALHPSGAGLYESPVSLVEELLRLAKGRPQFARLITPRGLALYSIAAEREPPCSGNNLPDRSEAWKKNLQRARRGTQN